jgi:hypothetical protein
MDNGQNCDRYRLISDWKFSRWWDKYYCHIDVVNYSLIPWRQRRQFNWKRWSDYTASYSRREISSPFLPSIFSQQLALTTCLCVFKNLILPTCSWPKHLNQMFPNVTENKWIPWQQAQGGCLELRQWQFLIGHKVLVLFSCLVCIHVWHTFNEELLQRSALGRRCNKCLLTGRDM